jgi:hypothetical protein
MILSKKKNSDIKQQTAFCLRLHDISVHDLLRVKQALAAFRRP